MTINATSITALLAGVEAAAVLYFLGPRIDQPNNPASGYLLVLGALLVGVPAYFCVLGLKRSDLVGMWVLNPTLLKRVGLWLLAAASCTAVLALIFNC
jgi:hypothetical protein